MKVLKKFIKQAIAEDAMPIRKEYGVNFYKPKKDNSFLSYIARKNPFAYYLLQTNMPNETIKEDPWYRRIYRVFAGSNTRKMDPRTGTLFNNDYGSGRVREYPSNYFTSEMNELRKDLNKVKSWK